MSKWWRILIFGWPILLNPDCTHKELHPESTLGLSWLQSTLSSEKQTGRSLLDRDLGSRRITKQIHPSSRAVKRKDETSANEAVFSSLQFSCAVYSISARFPNTLSHEPVGLWSIGMPTQPISLPLRPVLEFPERARAWKVWQETWMWPRMYAEPVIIEMLNRVDADVMRATEFSVWFFSTAGAKPKTSWMLIKPYKTWQRVSERGSEETWKTVFVIPLLSFHHATQWRWND